MDQKNLDDMWCSCSHNAVQRNFLFDYFVNRFSEAAGTELFTTAAYKFFFLACVIDYHLTKENWTASGLFNQFFSWQLGFEVKDPASLRIDPQVGALILPTTQIKEEKFIFREEELSGEPCRFLYRVDRIPLADIQNIYHDEYESFRAVLADGFRRIDRVVEVLLRLLDVQNPVQWRHARYGAVIYMCLNTLPSSFTAKIKNPYFYDVLAFEKIRPDLEKFYQVIEYCLMNESFKALSGKNWNREYNDWYDSFHKTLERIKPELWPES